MNRILIALIILLSFAAGPARAEIAGKSAMLVRCPKHPVNVTLIRKALAQSVVNSIDTDLYENIKVRVRLTLKSATKQKIRHDLTDILSGFDISTNALLVPETAGKVEFNPTCAFEYIARTRIRAVDKATGTKVNTVREIPLVINSAGESRGRLVE